MKFQTTIKLVAMTFIALLGLTACPGKNNNAAPGPVPQPCPVAVVPGQPCPVPIGGQLCQGCVAGGAMIASSYGRVANRSLEMAITFTTNQVMPGVPGGQALPGEYSYTGQAIAMGTVFVGPGLANRVCNIPPGQYTVVTMRPADWTMKSLYNLQIEAQGPVRVAMTLPSNWILNAVPPAQGINGQYPFHLQGDVLIESLNGQPCRDNGYPLVKVLE